MGFGLQPDSDVIDDVSAIATHADDETACGDLQQQERQLERKEKARAFMERILNEKRRKMQGATTATTSTTSAVNEDVIERLVGTTVGR
jgi:hypothetical protein